MRRVGGLLVVLVLGTGALLAGCQPGKPPPPPPPPCRETPTGGEALGTQRYRDPVFTQVTVECDLVYGQAPDEHGATQKLRLDVYEPAGDTAAARPLLVWLHWGGFIGGNKAEPPHPEYASRFARRGYVVAMVEYRVREGSTFDYHPPFDAGDAELLEAATDAQHDAQAAVRWLRAHAVEYGVDPDRIATVGISAGGMTALAVDYDETDVGTSGNPGYPSDVAVAVALEGCALDLSWIDGGEGPVLLVHSDADAGVPYTCAVDTRDTAQSMGDVAILDTRSGGEPHGFTADPNQAVAAVSQFLFARL